MKILTIGAAMRDLFLEYENPETMTFDIEGCQIDYIMLEEGKKIELDEIEHHTGGGATNSACSFQKLDFSVSSFFKVGKDPEGNFIIASLKKQKINLSNIVRSEGAPTGRSFIIPSPSGDKVILVYRGANLTIRQDELPQKAIEACDQLYITSLSKKTSKLLPIITKLAKQYEKPVATNPGTSQLTVNIKTLEQSLKNIDILILNCFEATLLMEHLVQAKQMKSRKTSSTKRKKRELPDLLAAPIVRGTSCFTLQQYFQEILKRGPQIVVVTNGADGVYATDGKQIYYHPSLPGKPVSTVGAGDAFGSTFVAQLLHGTSIEDAIRSGIINSYEVIQKLDATSGQLTKNKLNARVNRLDKKLLQTFKL